VNKHRNRVEVTVLLAIENRKGNKMKYTLHAAALNGDTEIAEFLIIKGTDVNIRNYIDETPLHGAVFNGHIETVELLIFKGADVKAKDEEGWTPLHWAVCRENKEIAELLISKGAV